MKNIHFISIGGSAMHNLAIALKNKGYQVTGTDDEIAEPSRSRLKAHGLLPASEGWNPALITSGLEAVIVGMHARADNPELAEARRLGLKIFSYPEFIYEQSKDKFRVVIGGSHGKTTTTAMIMHVLQHEGLNFDYMVGAALPGFELTVKLSADAPLIIIEGDEYLASPLDPRPKFHLYKASLAVITGIAWDHVNVFATPEIYRAQFSSFLDTLADRGILIYNEQDAQVCRVAEECSRTDLEMEGYSMPVHEVREGITFLKDNRGRETPLFVFGEHNLLNMNAAFHVCTHLGITQERFYAAISGFKGASRRLEYISGSDQQAVFWDFAHSPSKLKATTTAVKEQFPLRKLIACMELHTFSSLNTEFLDQYAGSMDLADLAIVYYNPATLLHKKLSALEPETVKTAFGRDDLKVFTDSSLLEAFLKSLPLDSSNLLLMSSGNFGGLDIKAIPFSFI